MFLSSGGLATAVPQHPYILAAAGTGKGGRWMRQDKDRRQITSNTWAKRHRKSVLIDGLARARFQSIPETPTCPF